MIKYKIQFTIFLRLLFLQLAISSYTPSLYRQVSHDIRLQTNAYVHLKGSKFYEKRRQVKNGLCKYIFPDVVAVPKSTKDVAEIIKISRRYQVPISVRSGGHSFLCQSIKPGNKSNNFTLVS